MTNYYKILGVHDFASNSEIKTAYRKLSKKFHPDVNQGDKFFEERFKEIQSAYEFLCDSIKRQRLDEFLKQAERKDQYQSQENKSDKSQNREEPKSRSQNTHSTTSNSENKKDNVGQNPQTSEKKKSGNISFILVVITAAIFFGIYKIASNKSSQDTSFNNQNTTNSSSYTPSTEQYNNYQPSINQENYDENSVELNGSTKAYGSFSIGSNKHEVLNIQGNPTRTMKLEALNKEIWSYGNSSVTFSNGKVSEYSDFDNNLKVQYSAGNEVSQSDNFSRSGNFSIGSDKSEVLRIQGNPTRTMKLEALNKEIWSYGNSSVTFSNGKVSEYSDFDNNLKVQYSAGNEVSQSDNFSRSGNFSIGSDKSEVLRIQGNPTRTMKLEALNKEIWSYGNSSVTFSDGRVSEYSNFDNNLKVQY
jgi:curved DNA-binding protein CbpA